jgi:hypothetical protein
MDFDNSNSSNNHHAAADPATTYEDALLWDELHHQQTREIQQHHARTTAHRNSHQTTPYHPSSAISDRRFSLIRRILQQTQEEASRFSHVVLEAASDAWCEHEHRRRRDRHHRRRLLRRGDDAAVDDHNTYLQEFGIAVHDDDDGTDHAHDPEMQQQQQHDDTINHPNDFVVLPPDRHRRRYYYGAVANLDLFFSSLYSYYYHRGLVPIVGKGVVQVVSLLFTLWLSIVLFVYLDWTALATCTDETTCRSDLASYVFPPPHYHRSSWGNRYPNPVWSLLVICYVGLFLAYAVFAIWSGLQTVREALDAKFVFEERLGISARKLEGGAVDWNRDVVDKLLELQRSGQYRVAIHGQDLDALVIANRILRKENFMVALFNQGVFDLTVPYLGDRTFFCSSLEVSKSDRKRPRINGVASDANDDDVTAFGEAAS